MKYFAFVLIFFLSYSCSYFRKDGAVKYNNEIIDLQSKILFKMDTFANSFVTNDSEVMTRNLKVLQLTIDSCIGVVNAMEAFDGNTELKDAGIKLFDFYKKAAETDYQELVDLLKKEDFTDADKNRIDEINARIALQEEPLDLAMKTAQANLAKKYNFKLENGNDGK